MLIHYFCIVLCHSSHRPDTSTPPLTMAGMIWEGTCNFVHAMKLYLHKIERLDKLASVPRKVGVRNAQFCVCASLVCTRLENEVDPHSLSKISFHGWRQLVPYISSSAIYSTVFPKLSVTGCDSSLGEGWMIFHFQLFKSILFFVYWISFVFFNLLHSVDMLCLLLLLYFIRF